jgi:predicted ATPase/class 3 adenylate cyclase
MAAALRILAMTTVQPASDTRSGSGIRTPDQRLRVFVSSTLGELAPEREAARTAIKTLRLTPVMFELGARPHPPQQLYRAYLEQSQVFVGIYWESYGWVAPDAVMSGIEDEWRLAGDRPRLIYVKEPSPDRQPELARMLDRIKSGGVSYKEFSSPGQLAEQLVDDLALLISERFESVRPASRLPAGTVTFLISDLEDSTGLLERLADHYVELLRLYKELVARCVGGQGGSLVESEGDGLLCAFANTGDAARAAVAIQHGMGTQTWPGGEAVKARLGLHTGSVRSVEGSYVGLELHRAFRIAAAANGGQTLISSTSRRLLEDTMAEEGWRADDLGYFALKGLSRTEHIYRLEVPGLPIVTTPVRAKAADTVVRLPAQLSTLVGRDREMGEVAALLKRSEVRLVTLTGPGGIGKTRLGVAVARLVADGYPDGVYFVDLAGLTGPDVLFPQSATVLGVPVENRGSIRSILIDFLAPKRLLLVLDNFDHLVATAAPQISELLAHCPGLEVLVTSRIALRLSGEHEYQVPPLQVPDTDFLQRIATSEAVRLFVDRAAAVRPGFSLNPSNASTIAEICRTLDGLPLAIELAAARLKLLTPQALLERLGRRFDLLTGGPIDAPDRHRTLRAAISWSFETLAPAEQKLFARLGVFAGGGSFDAVQEVCARDLGDALPLIESLVDKSLVRVVEGPDLSLRVQMLSTLADFAGEELERSEDAESIRQGHAEYFCDFARAVAPRLRGPDQRQGLQECDAEFHNLQTAGRWLLDHDQPGKVVRLMTAAWPFFWLRGHMVEGRRWSDRMADPKVHLTPAEKGWALFLAAGSALELGDYDPALSLATAALVEFDEAHEPSGTAWAHFIRAAVLPSFAFDPQSASAVGHVTAAAQWFHAAGDAWGEAYAYNYLGSVAAMQGRSDDALSDLHHCLQLATTLQNEALIGQAHNLLGFAHLLAGDRENARRSLAAAAAVYQPGYLLEGLALCLEMISGLLVAEGDQLQAMTAFGAAEAIRDVIQLRPWPITRSFIDALSTVAGQSPDCEAARAAGRLLGPQSAAELAVTLVKAGA